jgi:hypothetical protein
MKFKKIETKNTEPSAVTEKDFKMIRATITFPAHKSLGLEDILSELEGIFSAYPPEKDSEDFMVIEESEVTKEDISKWTAKNKTTSAWICYNLQSDEEYEIGKIFKKSSQPSGKRRS